MVVPPKNKSPEKSAKALPWRYPGGRRPEYFNRPGREFTPEQRDFVTRFFYLPYASQVPGLIGPTVSRGRRDNATPVKNPNYVIVCRVAASVLWYRDANRVEEAICLNARKTLAIVFRTFNPVKGEFENYFLYIFRQLIKRWAKAEWKRLLRRGEISLDLAKTVPPPLQGHDPGTVFAPNKKNGQIVLESCADGIETPPSLLEAAESRHQRPRRARYVLEHLTAKQRESLHNILRGFRTLRATKPDAEWSDLCEMLAGSDAWAALTDRDRKHETDNLRQTCSRLFGCLVRWGAEFERQQEDIRGGHRDSIHI